MFSVCAVLFLDHTLSPLGLDRQSKVIVVHHPKLVLAYCHVLASRLRRIISSSFLESLRTDPAWFFFHILLRLAPRRFYCFPLTTRLLPPSFLSSYASSAVYYFAISYKPPISVLPELSSPYHPRLLLCSLCHRLSAHVVSRTVSTASKSATLARWSSVQNLLDGHGTHIAQTVPFELNCCYPQIDTPLSPPTLPL